MFGNRSNTVFGGNTGGGLMGQSNTGMGGGGLFGGGGNNNAGKFSCTSSSSICGNRATSWRRDWKYFSFLPQNLTKGQWANRPSLRYKIRWNESFRVAHESALRVRIWAVWCPYVILWVASWLLCRMQQDYYIRSRTEQRMYFVDKMLVSDIFRWRKVWCCISNFLRGRLVKLYPDLSAVGLNSDQLYGIYSPRKVNLYPRDCVWVWLLK